MDKIKDCPSCCERINAKAIRCPRCQSWQSKWRFDQSNIKHQVVFFSFIMLFFGALYSGLIGNILSSENFYESKSLIQITNSNFNYSIEKCGARISVIGIMANNSNKTWKDIYFEVRFFNKNNELIDTVSDNNYELVLLPNDTSSFKITGSADKGKDAYDHHEIIIKSAREGGGLF